MKTLNLKTGWRLRDEALSVRHQDHGAVLSRHHRWREADLPCDVHVPLIEDGTIPEPLEKLNCYESEWIEKKSWWFFNEFAYEGDVPCCTPAYIVMDYLDIYADIYLNGTYLGCHQSVHYPFSRDVRDLLIVGKNRLLVRVTAGPDRVTDDSMGDLMFAVSTETGNGRNDRGEVKRAFLRKPQYVFGWDWGPRVASCGIGSARIDFTAEIQAESVSVSTASIGDDQNQAALSIAAIINNAHPFRTIDAEWSITVTDPDGAEVATMGGVAFLTSGYNRIDRTIYIDKPRLWWPNGYGKQPLYRIALRSGISTWEDTFGIRTIEIDTSKIPARDGERTFAVVVNGITIFAKGGNWIPADSIWQRVDTAKYKTLINEAVQANFNMLRIWGGGIYERETFYRLCDEQGILVWQDLMFGCGMYPDREEWFQSLVEKEIRYQAARLHNRPCMALWCGNNENHWAWDTDWYGGKAPYFGGEIIYNRMAPEIIREVTPHIPYWNSSPYGGDSANSELAGDTHNWHQWMMNPKMDTRIDPLEYDKTESKFVSEYGYVGPLPRESIEKYFSGEDIEVGGKIWQHHNNAFEKDTVKAGIARHYRDPENLSLDEYLLYAGLTQGLMYNYSLESLRYKDFCNGGLIWMYNDTWGETGWTIIDYYTNRKISFPFVARALSPVKLILRRQGDTIGVVLCNDSAAPIAGSLEFGGVGYDGTKRSTQTIPVSMAGRSRGIVTEFSIPAGTPHERAIFAQIEEEISNCLPATLWEIPFRERSLPASQLEYSVSAGPGSSLVVEVSSPVFAHAVHFSSGVEYHCSDEYFNLLPAETRTVVISPRPGHSGSLQPEDIKPAAVT